MTGKLILVYFRPYDDGNQRFAIEIDDDGFLGRCALIHLNIWLGVDRESDVAVSKLGGYETVTVIVPPQALNPYVSRSYRTLIDPETNEEKEHLIGVMVLKNDIFNDWSNDGCPLYWSPKSFGG